MDTKQIETMTEVHPIFEDCKAKESTRYAINYVWVKRGYRVATDGCICVREKCDAPDSEELGAPFPDERGLGWDRKMHSFAPLPTYEDTYDKCTECKGVGKVQRDCAVCNGCGQIECDSCGQDTDCDDCDGRGTNGPADVPCGRCDSTGKIITNPSVPIDGFTERGLAAMYVRVLRKHGVDKVEILEKRGGGADERMLRFHVPGTDIFGLVMTMLLLKP